MTEYRCVFAVAFMCREGDVTAELELTLPFVPFVGLNVAGLFAAPADAMAKVMWIQWNPADETFRVAYESPVGGMDDLGRWMRFDGRMARFDDVRRLFLGCGWRWVRVPEKARKGGVDA